MLDSGVDFDDLVDIVPVVVKKKVKAKYRVVVNDITHEWSGRGRTPGSFSAVF